jgi:hypothetical protein
LQQVYDFSDTLLAIAKNNGRGGETP